MPAQKQLRKAAGDEVLTAVKQQKRPRVRLTEHEADETDGRDAFADVLQHLTRLLHLLLTLILQLDVARDRLREVEEAAVLDGSEDEARGEASHVVHNVVRRLLTEAQHGTHRHHIALAFRQHLLQHALLDET